MTQKRVECKISEFDRKVSFCSTRFKANPRIDNFNSAWNYQEFLMRVNGNHEAAL